MTPHVATDAALAAEFIGYHRLALDSDNILRRQGAEWASDLLGELACNDPVRCWQVAKTIASDNPGEDAMVRLGYVLSTLLTEHPEMVDTMEEDSRSNGDLCTLLSWVVEDEHIPERVWQKVILLSEDES